MSYNTRRPAYYGDINSDEPSRSAIAAIMDARSAMDEMPFHIVDKGSLTLGQLERLVKRFKRRFAARGGSLDLVVVDYLQLLRCDTKMTSSYEVVSEISRRLKGIAKDYDVALFALAQLNRKVEDRADKRPQLADLRDSGQIEQDADAVLFFYRHAYYLRKEILAAQHEAERADLEAALAGCEHAIEFICAKRRNGPEGSAVGQFFGAYQAVRG